MILLFKVIVAQNMKLFIEIHAFKEKPVLALIKFSFDFQMWHGLISSQNIPYFVNENQP